MASALHTDSGNDDDRFTRYDQRLKEVRRLLDQRNERSSAGQGQMVSLLRNIADGIQNVTAPRMPTPQAPLPLPTPPSPLSSIAPDPRLMPMPPPRPSAQTATGQQALPSLVHNKRWELHHNS